MTTHADGSTSETSRKYSLHRSLLVVEEPEGELEPLHMVEGDTLILTDEILRARLRRTN
ncbi:MAG: hypothetical protein ACYTJ0_03425 [Planctomycetota bacterium]